MQYTVARSSAPTCYPPRVKLEPGASWDKLPDGYDPVDYTDPLVLANAEDLESGNKWADVERPALSVLGKRKSFAAGDSSSLDIVASIDEATKRFRNPGGPVGLSGRGLLGRYGPNHAADPIVTRFHDGRLQVVLVRRRDSDELAFPGGMVDPGSTVSRTLKGEFTEEAAKPGGAVDRLFAEGERGVVYRGLVDDRRTTDHAWIATTAVHFHAPPDVANELELSVTDVNEVSGVGWYDVDSVTTLYASHKEWLDMVKSKFSPTAATGPAYPFARR
jgi:ADP-ribose pyrophosphatase